MDFAFVALQMITVSLPIVVGWVAHKAGLMDDAFDTRLSKLVLNVGLPAMIIASLGSQGGLPSAEDMAWGMVAMTVMQLMALAVAFIMVAAMRAPRGTEGVYRFIITFGNCGFIGFPVISAVLGEQALLIAAIGLIPLNFVIYTVGIMMFSGSGGGVRGVLRSCAACLKMPTLIASMVVAACVAFNFTDLGVVGDSLSIVGQLTTPAALLLMGSSIAKYEPLSMLTNWRAYVAAAGRLLVAPLAGLALLKILPISEAVLAVVVLECAMPVATNGTLYCLQYGKDTKPMMQGTFISIIAAILTIPLVVVLAQM